MPGLESAKAGTGLSNDVNRVTTANRATIRLFIALMATERHGVPFPSLNRRSGPGQPGEWIPPTCDAVQERLLSENSMALWVAPVSGEVGGLVRSRRSPVGAEAVASPVRSPLGFEAGLTAKLVMAIKAG